MKEPSLQLPAALLARLALTVFLSGCQTPHDERSATPWITTMQRLTLLSANDGQAHLKLDPAHMTSNIPMKLNRDFTRDSITIVHLGPDHPPIVKTVYGTVPNTINLVPYASMTRDGRYGFVVSNTNGLFASEPADLLSVIDLSSAEPSVIQKVEIPSPWMALVHPDGKHVVVSYALGFQVFDVDGFMLNRSPFVIRVGHGPASMALGRRLMK